jgi:predicted O-methyltransferase YrrM
MSSSTTPSLGSKLRSRAGFYAARLQGRKGVRPRRYENVIGGVTETKAKTLLEVGVYRGQRSLRMIEEAKKFHAASEVEYLGFDLFEEFQEEILASELSKKPQTQAQLQAMLEKTGAKVRLFKGYSQETLPRFVEECKAGGKMIDFAFIDGGHLVETIQADWDNVSALMHPGSIVMFDDYYSNTEAEMQKFGCQTIIDALDRSVYDVAVLEPEELFKQDSGITLRIRIAKVTKK